MNLTLNPALARDYKSLSQKARVITEHWAKENLFCPACTADSLDPLPPNARVADYRCDGCCAKFQ